MEDMRKEEVEGNEWRVTDNFEIVNQFVFRNPCFDRTYFKNKCIKKCCLWTRYSLLATSYWPCF